MGVSVFAVAGRSGTVVAVLTLTEPAGECFSEFFENALCSKIEDFWHHERRSLSNELD
jgi:hypothetical protein